MAGGGSSIKVAVASAAAVALVCFTGCPGDEGPPGVTMGTYEFSATPLVDPETCKLAELESDGGVPAGFGFVATLSQEEADPAKAYLTIDKRTRDALYEGFVFTSSFSAPRTFAECECATVSLEETLQVILVSESQDQAIGRTCPPNALTGGIPAPGSDAGIEGPRRDPGGGFDARRACGELLDAVVPGEGCACAPCQVRYQVSGCRRIGDSCE